VLANRQEQVFALLARLSAAATASLAAREAATELQSLLGAAQLRVTIADNTITPRCDATAAQLLTVAVPPDPPLCDPLTFSHCVPIELHSQRLGSIEVLASAAQPLQTTDLSLITAVAAQLAQTIERTWLLEATERWATELSGVYDTAVAISAQLDLPTTLHAIVEQATALVHADGGGLYLCDEAAEELEIVVSYRLDRDYCGQRIRIGEGLAGRAAVSRQIEVTDDYGSWEGRAPTYADSPFHAVIAVPLVQDDRVLGVLDLLHFVPDRRFSPADIAVVKRLAVQAVVAISNARLYDSAYHYANRMTVLARASQLLDVQGDITASLRPLAEAGAQVLDAQACLVVFSDADHAQTSYTVGLHDNHATLLRLRLAATTACDPDSAQVRCHNDLALTDGGETFAEAALDLGFRSLITLPLLRNDAQIGTAAYLYTTPHVWTQDEIEIARIVVNQMAAMVANALLYREVHEANRLKAEFVSTMSHELRTPMGAIIGYTELVAGGSYGALPASMNEPLLRVQSNAQHLLTLINQMLDLSRIEAQRLELHNAPYSPHDLLHSVNDVMEPLAQGRSLHLHLHIAADVPPIVMGDVGRVRQILINLVGNSVKFTPSGSIHLRCTIDRSGDLSQLQFDVCDTGIGIPVDQRSFIWEPFRQGDSSSTREYGGTGLGLAIVKRLTNLMGGDVAVQSEVGMGSTFTVRLPLQVPR
jgi:signal transduction histidine kinase/putative methionine-R-sulfoxide reductase with GAF domain